MRVSDHARESSACGCACDADDELPRRASVLKRPASDAAVSCCSRCVRHSIPSPRSFSASAASSAATMAARLYLASAILAGLPMSAQNLSLSHSSLTEAIASAIVFNVFGVACSESARSASSDMSTRVGAQPTQNASTLRRRSCSKFHPWHTHSVVQVSCVMWVCSSSFCFLLSPSVCVFSGEAINTRRRLYSSKKSTQTTETVSGLCSVLQGCAARSSHHERVATGFDCRRTLPLVWRARLCRGLRPRDRSLSHLHAAVQRYIDACPGSPGSCHPEGTSRILERAKGF